MDGRRVARLGTLAVVGLLMGQVVLGAGPEMLTQPMPPTYSVAYTFKELGLSLGILIFGLAVLGMEMAVLWRQKQGWGQNSTRIFGLTLVVIAGLFLVTAGYSENQMAPMIGLLGTIAGYLLGKADSPG